MLLSLYIKNYALINEVCLEFGSGLNIFTGETGAGKSIIIECIGLILGERSSAQAIRKGERSCFITAEFDCSKFYELKKYLEKTSLGSLEDNTILIRREVDNQGKNRAFINDRPVNISTLSTIGQYIIDIHGQHGHQSLFQNVKQRGLLDSFGSTEKLMREVSDKYRFLQQISAQKESQKMSEQERQRLIDIYTFQLKEIDEAKLFLGEDEEIERILPQLKNAEKLRELGEEAYLMLYGAEQSMLDNFGKIQKLVESINNISGMLTETAAALKTTCMNLEEISCDIQNFKDSLNVDPEKLNEILERQDLIHKLKRKYGAAINDILLYRDKVFQDLSVVSFSEENQQELDKNIEKAKVELFCLCDKLTVARKKAADKLVSAVQNELSSLGMKKAHFDINFEKDEHPSSHGWDKIEFMFSANKGEDLKPLKSIVSGGEISRVMLAIKTVFAKTDNIPILIFDEIDTGIGGPMGQVVGKKLKELAMHRQIICITHLPQIAAFADNHIFVEKNLDKGRTFTNIRILNSEQHVEEIARMLSGEEITVTARKHAFDLIENSCNIDIIIEKACKVN